MEQQYSIELSMPEIKTIYKQGKFNLDSLDLIITDHNIVNFFLKAVSWINSFLKKLYEAFKCLLILGSD